MDKERKRRRQTLKIVVIDTLIVLAVIGVATLLSLFAMGYKLNGEGKIDQAGLLQVETRPTGATVTVDDESLFFKTNMSHMLSEGSHSVKLTKDGYDSWEGQVEIKAGKLYKLDYPWLFKSERVEETVKKFDEGGLKFLSASPDRRSILYQKADSPNWSVMDINSDKAEVVEFDVSAWTGELTDITWAANGDVVLTKWKNDDVISFRLINLRKPDQSLDLSAEFGMDFSKMRFIGNSPEQLFALENGNLRRVSVANKEVSKVLLSSVSDFYNDGTNIVYVATNEGGERSVGFYQEGGSSISLRKVKGDGDVSVFLSEYLGEKYIGMVMDGRITIYKGEFPTESSKLSEMEKVISQESGYPGEFMNKASGRLMVATNGDSLLVFDAERGKVISFTLESKGSFATDLLIANADSSELYLRDYDGTNKRKLASSAASGYDAVISRNNKWLYFVATDANGALELKREEI